MVTYYRTLTILLNLCDKYCTLQPAEYAMFNYFNNSLWEQIGREQNDFWEELEHFRGVNKQVSDFCQGVLSKLRSREDLAPSQLRNGGDVLAVKRSKWNRSFQWKTTDCLLMALHKFSFRYTYY